MSVEADVRAGLLAQAGLTALIGQRLYLLAVPQNPTYPAVAFSRVSTQTIYAHQFGGTQGKAGWCRFQFTILADGATGAARVLAVRDALKAALQTFNAGPMAASPYALVQAPNFILQERMSQNPQLQQPIAEYYIDTKIWWTE